MVDPLAPFFLGSYAENNDFFEKTIVELLRDHFYWRRNFHPEDTPPISTVDQYERQYLEGLARTRRELHELTAQLKRSVPFFHPRYVGHMVSDLLMPGLIAQLVTTLYNPNNVADDAAPVTIGLELEVGRQLARMVGFRVDPTVEPCGFGHLTSGGTIANDEALWVARAVKLYPLAVSAACRELDAWPVPWLKGADDWQLLNQSVSSVTTLAQQLRLGPEATALRASIERHRVESLGLARFCAAHPLVANLAVVAPGTAHYSWQKAVKLLGLGVDQLLEVPTRHARIDVGALDAMLEQAAKARQPVLAVVGVYGTTEFGTFDPIHELVAQRGKHLEFWCHVDAAWGGYVPSTFRDSTGALLSREEVRRGFRQFPSERVYRSTEALRWADSITVDPHKMGFVPYGAGAFLLRNRQALELIEQHAAYVFSGQPRQADREAADDRYYSKLGRFTLEGSRPGAAAAACYVNHRVLPLDAAHFGAMIGRTIRSTERLCELLGEAAAQLEGTVRIIVPFEPDTNVVCIALNASRNRSVKAANALTRRVFEALAVGPDRPIQFRAFFGSNTTVTLSHLGEAERMSLGEALGLDLVDPDADGLFLLRHTLMNPWLDSAPNGHSASYVEAFCQYLIEAIRAQLGRSG